MKIRVGRSTIIVGGYPLLLCESFTFEPGRVYCIRGRSGTGKTSFLNALTGSHSVSTSGSPIQYILDSDKKETFAIDKPLLGAQLVVLQQSTPLWPHISAFNNAWLPWACQHGIKEMFRRRKLSMERARNWLTKLGLDASVWRRKPFSLSGGERQRAALAAVLVFDSPCILLDEPTSNLDRASINLVSDVLRKESERGKLIIVTSHDVDFLENQSWHHLVIDERSLNPPRFRLHEVE